MICERCSAQVYLIEKCGYCDRSICVNCVKSAKRQKKIRRIVICKDCWGDIPKRTKYKREK